MTGFISPLLPAMNKMTKNRMKKLGIGIIIMAMTIGCTLIQFRNTLDEKREAWDALNITDYSYDYHALCFCPYEYTAWKHIVVSNDVIVNVSYVETNLTIPASEYAAYPTVDGLFDMIEKALADKVDSIEVEYDQTHDYPVHIALDPIYNAIDDEISYIATNLVID